MRNLALKLLATTTIEGISCLPALCRRASWAGLGRSFPLAKPPAVPFAVLTFALGLPMFARSVPLRLGLRLGQLRRETCLRLRKDIFQGSSTAEAAFATEARRRRLGAPLRGALGGVSQHPLR